MGCLIAGFKLVFYLIVAFFGLPSVIYAKAFPSKYGSPSWWAVLVLAINVVWVAVLFLIGWHILLGGI